jgi:hypothetical protein
MVNQSKAKDQRFWKVWRASGAVGTIDDAYRRQFSEWDNYQNLLKNVNAGYLTSEPGARKMVEEHGLPVAKLEAALETGRAVRL